jgi:hypothetical protein
MQGRANMRLPNRNKKNGERLLPVLFGVNELLFIT